MRFSLCILSLYLTSNILFPQEFTEKYNTEFERTDFYDKLGRWIGYSKENMRFNRLEYYDTTHALLKYVRMDSSVVITLANDPEVKKEGIKRWNKFFQRYDVFDSSGKQIGYYKYHPSMRKWVFTYGYF